jgi:hypothetical protein
MYRENPEEADDRQYYDYYLDRNGSSLKAENKALCQPPVIGSFSLSEIWKMAHKYNCDDFVKMVEEVNGLNDL